MMFLNAVLIFAPTSLNAESNCSLGKPDFETSNFPLSTAPSCLKLVP